MNQMTREQAEAFKARMAEIAPDIKVEVNNLCVKSGYFDGEVVVTIGNYTRRFYGSIRDAYAMVEPTIAHRQLIASGVVID